MLKNSIIIIAIIALISSCSSEPAKPDPFLEEEEMVEFITDLSLAEGARQFARPVQRKKNLEKLTINDYYSLVFEKHGITEAQFDSISNWYVQHPKIYDNIHKQVIDNLNKMLAEEQKFQKEASMQKLSKQIPDSLNLK